MLSHFTSSDQHKGPSLYLRSSVIVLLVSCLPIQLLKGMQMAEGRAREASDGRLHQAVGGRSPQHQPSQQKPRRGDEKQRGATWTLPRHLSLSRLMTGNKRITHSSQSGNQEQTARRCQEPELEEEQKKKWQNESQALYKPTFTRPPRHHHIHPADLRLHRRNTLQRRQSINNDKAVTVEGFRCR